MTLIAVLCGLVCVRFMLGGLRGSSLRDQYHFLLVEIQRQLTSESKRMPAYGLPEVEDRCTECELVIEEQSRRNAQAELEQLLRDGPLNPEQQAVFERVQQAYNCNAYRGEAGTFIFVQVSTIVTQHEGEEKKTTVQESRHMLKTCLTYDDLCFRLLGCAACALRNDSMRTGRWWHREDAPDEGVRLLGSHATTSWRQPQCHQSHLCDYRFGSPQLPERNNSPRSIQDSCRGCRRSGRRFRA